MRSLHIVLASAMLATACDQSPRSIPTNAGMETPRGADPVVMAKRRAAGRWRSEPGILPGDPKLWVIVDVAGDQSLRIEKRGMSSRFEAVYAQASGKVTTTDDGIAGEAPDADGSLTPFRTFTASFPSPAKMLVKTGDQSFAFRFDGV